MIDGIDLDCLDHQTKEPAGVSNHPQSASRTATMAPKKLTITTTDYQEYAK
jgi:hypothetical protein